MKCKLFLAISFLCHTSFLPLPFFFTNSKSGNIKILKRNPPFFFSRNSCLLCHLSFPDLFSLLILQPCKLLFFLFLSPHFFPSSFFSPQEISPGCPDVKRCLSSLRPKAPLRAGCMVPIVVMQLRSASILQTGPAFTPRAHCSPSHRPHRWASSSHTGRRTGTCAPRSWDHALLHPPFRRHSLRLVPARRKKGEEQNRD